MKRIFMAVMLILLLLMTACGGQTPPVASESPAISTAPVVEFDYKFTRENFPRLDGSTSMVPMAKTVTAVLLGEETNEVEDLISFNRTSQSFLNLMFGECDMLMVAEPAESVLELLEKHEFEYEMTQISTDALIFVVSEDNPIESLTTEQIQKIYTGEITNWSEVGGNDVEIIPFQRNAEAGSQAAMLRLVMSELEMMEPPEVHVIDSMMGLMEAVKNFDGSEGAIGYSVYYYANDMKMADGLKIISVDGIEPGTDTIRSGEYPFLAPSYTVIAKDSPEGSPARKLSEWLLSEEGQYLVSALGYVSVRG